METRLTQLSQLSTEIIQSHQDKLDDTLSAFSQVKPLFFFSSACAKVVLLQISAKIDQLLQPPGFHKNCSILTKLRSLSISRVIQI